VGLEARETRPARLWVGGGRAFPGSASSCHNSNHSVLRSKTAPKQTDVLVVGIECSMCPQVDEVTGCTLSVRLIQIFLSLFFLFGLSFFRNEIWSVGATFQRPRRPVPDDTTQPDADAISWRSRPIPERAGCGPGARVSPPAAKAAAGPHKKKSTTGLPTRGDTNSNFCLTRLGRPA